MLRFLSYASGSAEPVSADEAMTACRIDSDLSAQVALVVAASRQQAEQQTGRTYRRQVLREELADWPSGSVNLPVWQPASAVVTYRSAAQPDQWTTLGSGVYRFAPYGSGARLALADGQAWPDLASSDWGMRVRVDITAGPTSSGEVPDCVRQYILANVAAWIDQPAGLVDGRMQVNPLHDRLLDSERVY